MLVYVILWIDSAWAKQKNNSCLGMTKIITTEITPPNFTID